MLFGKTLKRNESLHRQLQYIGALTQEADLEPIRKALDENQPILSSAFPEPGSILLSPDYSDTRSKSLRSTCSEFPGKVRIHLDRAACTNDPAAAVMCLSAPQTQHAAGYMGWLQEARFLNSCVIPELHRGRVEQHE